MIEKYTIPFSPASYHLLFQDKHELINKLLEEGNGANYFANQIGISESVFKSYLIHPDIPPQIIERAKRNQGSFINLEKIRNLE